MSSFANIIIPIIYLRVIETLCKVIVFYGGRGGGKTQALIRLFLCICYKYPELNVLCARQTQDEYATTLRLAFKRVVDKDPQFAFMKKDIEFFRDRIVFSNGSQIFFVGLSEKTEDKIRGAICDFFWFDEAHELQKDTYEMLVPSIREHGSKVVISFNTRYEYDFVSQEFLKNPAPNVEVIQINAKDNPYLSPDHASQMEVDKVRLPYEEYLWKWEGGFKPQSETALFDNDVLRTKFYLNKTFEELSFTRIAIGIDPATTSKDYSNQSGLVVAGLLNSGEACLIEDCSGLLKPNELAKKCSELYHKYNADCVVIEVNQGGDYIKNTVLGYDSTLRVLEVRAKQDKIKRMLPIANELFLGRIKALSEKVGFEIATQFRKFTNNGYLGANGESPDRAEAFAWACFELLGISEYGRVCSIFKRDMMEAEIQGLAEAFDVGYIYVNAYGFGAVLINLFDLLGKKEIEVTKAITGELRDFKEGILGLGARTLMINKSHQGMISQLDVDCECFNYDDSLQGQDLILNTIPRINQNVNVLKCEPSFENGVKENLILRALERAEIDKEPTLILKAFCYCIIQEIIS